jgi:hypothetical protein
MTTSFEVIKQSNLCEINRMDQIDQSAGTPYEKSKKVSASITAVEAMIVHMYQLTSRFALLEREPTGAANFWKDYVSLCDAALTRLNSWKAAYPECGTGELYDLVLDYRSEADSRYYENTQDAEWETKFQTDPELKKLIGQF